MTIIENLEQLSKQINLLFKGSFLNKMQQISNYDFLFGFSKGKDKSLLISINVPTPFIKVISETYIQNENSIFFQHLKARLMNASFRGSNILNSDNILVLDFIKTTDTYDKINYNLMIELFKSNANMILLSDNKIVEAFRYKGIDTNHPILNNLIYEAPKNTYTQKEFTSEDKNKIEEYCLNINSKYLKEKYTPLLSLLKRKKKSLTKKLENLSEEKEVAKQHECFQIYGDYLKMNLSNVHKGDKSFFADGIEIPLKEIYSPTQNMQYFYKIYKKSKLTIDATDKYMEQTKNELSYLENIFSTIDFYDDQEFQELIVELTNNKLIKMPKIKQNKKKTTASKPSYVMFNNIKIGFGKNNSQNNELTFNLANKSDSFLHISKAHGPHIIIFDDNPSDEVIQFACEMALYLAKVPDGDVIFAKVMYLKKTPTLGQVRMNKYETYHMNKIRPEMRDYILKAKRF